eukprot:tig00020801_g13947.t1
MALATADLLATLPKAAVAPASRATGPRPSSLTLFHLPDELLRHVVEVGSLCAPDILAIRWTCSSLRERSGGLFGDECAARARTAADGLEALSGPAARPCATEARAVRDALEEAEEAARDGEVDAGEKKMKAFILANRSVQRAAVRLGAAKGEAYRALDAAARAAPAWFVDVTEECNRSRGQLPPGATTVPVSSFMHIVRFDRTTFKLAALAHGAGRGGRPGRSAEFEAAVNLNRAIESTNAARKDCAALAGIACAFDLGRSRTTRTAAGPWFDVRTLNQAAADCPDWACVTMEDWMAYQGLQFVSAGQPTAHMLYSALAKPGDNAELDTLARRLADIDRARAGSCAKAAGLRGLGRVRKPCA